MRSLAVIAAILPLLGACASGSSAIPPYRPQGAARPAPTPAPPPQSPAPVAVASGFRAPQVLNLPGLADVIGRSEAALIGLFGAPQLQVREGDAVKLQFAGKACVLDVFLYPLEKGAQPSATYVDARRASDGLDVDRVACVRALRR